MFGGCILSRVRRFRTTAPGTRDLLSRYFEIPQSSETARAFPVALANRARNFLTVQRGSLLSRVSLFHSPLFSSLPKSFIFDARCLRRFFRFASHRGTLKIVGTNLSRKEKEISTFPNNCAIANISCVCSLVSLF